MEDKEVKQWLNNIGIEPEKAVSSLSALQLFKLIKLTILETLSECGY